MCAASCAHGTFAVEFSVKIFPFFGETTSGPPKPLCQLLSSAGHGREIMPDSWVEIRTEGDHSPMTVTGKTGSAWGN